MGGFKKKTRKSLIIFFIGCAVGCIFYLIGNNNTISNNPSEASDNPNSISTGTFSVSEASNSLETDINSELDNTADSNTEVNSSSVNPTESTSISEFSDTTTSSIENKRKDLQPNWKIFFEKELKESYNVTVKKYEDLGDGLYGVYVNEIDTGKMPYVTVDSQTGNFHG